MKFKAKLRGGPLDGATWDLGENHLEEIIITVFNPETKGNMVTLYECSEEQEFGEGQYTHLIFDANKDKQDYIEILEGLK